MTVEQQKTAIQYYRELSSLCHHYSNEHDFTYSVSQINRTV